jgi:hypothetical protein
VPRASQTTTRSRTPRDPREWPTYWFAALETAVEEGDLQAAAEAQRQLERLGVSVTRFRPPPAGQEVGRG